MLRGPAFAPADPLAMPAAPRGSDSVYLSSGMFHGLFGPIPNLELGYLYSFGNRARTGRLTLDYLLPVSLGSNSVVFGEAHTEFTDFWKTLRGNVNNRVDLSFGGGYRTMLNDKTLVGVNGFYDSSRLAGTWYTSGGFGIEMAALIAGNDAVDLNFNWYGNLFNRSVILNAFRTGPSNYDFQAGYSHELWNQGPDLRLSATGYRFDVGSPVYGVNAGAELKSRDGMFVLKYQIGSDKLNRTYQTVGAFVNVGLQPENLLRGESPFTMPEPIFRSPRNLRRLLADKVHRNFHQAASALVAQAEQQGSRPAKPYFQFVLVDKNGPIATQYDQPAGVPVQALTWSGVNTASAKSYAVIVVDPDGTLPPTISVTITPTLGALMVLRVKPDFTDGTYTIPNALTDGTQNVVTGGVGLPALSSAKNPPTGTGFFTITDITTGAVTPLTVTVTGP